MRVILLFIGAFLTALPCLRAQNGKDPIKVTDMLKIASVGDIHLSPDGKLAVFTLTTIEPDTAGKPGKPQTWLSRG